ncbi:Concanavalin A-like lectin/glucanases superfamily [Candidatus Nanopelagicaceae bacterium]
MQFSHALNPRRVARSLVTVLLLTLIQSVAAPILSPVTQSERADAAPVSVAYASNTTGFSVVVPAGVFSVTLTARGAAGGKGGNDASAGLASTNVGSVTGTFAVTPGDRIAIYPGGAGGGGANSAANSGGGSAGSTSVFISGGTLTPTLRFNSVASAALIANGGTGGNAGSGGTSGSGGGGGAATIIAINDNVALVAGGGGGGGGGSGPGAQPWNGTHVANGSNPAGANGLYGGDCGNTDGGGSGGGGGGWYGGAAGTVDRPGGTGECRAFSGSAGGNFLGNTASSPSQGYVAANGAGEGTYDFIYSATTSCTTDQQTSDIYTIIKVTTTAECTWTVPSTVSVLDLFLVGGGGGGAGDAGPGGGGGATLSRTAIAVSPSSTMRLKVGYGGAGGGWGIVGSTSRGDSTTVVTSTGSVFYALGGTKSDNGPSATVTGNQTVQAGSFDGGIGGTATPNSNTVGGAGKPGVSNYFYGSQNTYAGGGGGGCYFGTGHNVSVAGAAGLNGGGSGCSYDTTTKNSNGGNGTPGTGGGGGGGGAGDALRTIGGKGGSGVILIRYATSAEDSFPVSLTSALQQRWSATDFQYLDSTRRGWMDSSGSNDSTRVLSGSTAQIVDAPATNGNSKTFKTLQGATTDRITLADLPTNYTLFHVARYNNGTKGRLITASSVNWLSGFFNGATGVSHHNWWMTPESGVISDSNKWLLSSDQLKNYRANGKDVTYNYDATPNGQYWVNYASTSSGFGINNSPYNDNSDWQVADVIVFNRQLSNGETRAMERYLTRVYGLTLDPASSSGETDTALSLDGNQYFYTQLNYGNTINDTFTIEAWINPSSECGAGGGVRCTIFSKEYAVRATIYDGKFGFIMYGTSTGWQWNDTSLKIPINEWHHIALVKRGVANSNGAVEIYLDGQLAYVKAGSPYLVSTANVTFNSADILRQNDDQWIYVGAALGSYDRFRGQLDEVKLWKVARTTSEIMQDMHSGDASNPSLQFYYDFNKSVGSKTENISNLGYGGGPRADLITVGSATYVDVKTTTTSSAYTTIKFPRTYITQAGGWTIPSNISTASAIVVGGGGGGGWNSGGGGGGGGFLSLPNTNVSGIVTVKVGVGGVGALATDVGQVPTVQPQDGQSSQFGSTVVSGGNKGTVYAVSTAGGASVVTASGNSGAGGNGAPSSGVPGSAGGTGIASTITGSNVIYSSGGGGGGYSSAGGAGGSGAGAGGGSGNSNIGQDAAANRGGGGGASGAHVFAGNGGSGVVILRYITAAKPSYTKPSNAYLNVGMTETFTTNVAVDSATAELTRTFKWESTTPTANGVYTVVKSGTGAANAAFSWLPTDTSTSGSGYLYRLTVTDSDTAGLFITDSSTAFAVINRTLQMTGVTSVKKQINVARNETFTISAGTPGYRYTISPTLPGVTLDTSTVGTALLKISDTASVGSYALTLTVTDSVSASVSIPIALSISAPPNLVNSSEIIENDLVFNIDMAYTASYSRVTGTISDISGTKKQVTINGGSTFSDDYSGILKLSTSQHISATGFSTLPSFTIEAYINLQSISSGQVCVFGSEQTPTNVAYFMCIDTTRTVFTGFYNGSWTYKRTSQTLTLGTWTHLVGTFDSTTAGTKMELYMDGSVATLRDSAQDAGLNPPTASTDRVFINKWFYTTTAPTSAMDIGFIRLYSAPFTQAMVTQNYNATKNRFVSSNISQLKPSQKYGTSTLDSFTATSGGESKTVSFAVGNRSGVAWDTSTVLGRVDLSIQDFLSAGSYYDTVTVTDNFGQSSYLPIKMTVTKADSLTVSMDTATSVSYNGSPITVYPRTTIKGLKSSDTATSSVRFSSSLYTESTVVPTNADTYTVRGAEPVFTIGLLSNYEGVIYETKTAVVRKINQRPLNIFKYGGTVGTSFVISLQGGDGTGAVTETLTGVSSLTGCAISNRMLSATEQKQGFCEVRVVKAGDQNYFAETETAQLYFMAFVNSQPTNQVGSGSTIGLNGITSVETSTVLPPSITGLSTLTLSKGAGGTFTITGTGFTGSISVKFWRNKVIITTSGSGTSIDIPVLDIANSGATSGRIAVITAAGEAVSVDSLTITP